MTRVLPTSVPNSWALLGHRAGEAIWTWPETGSYTLPSLLSRHLAGR